MEAQLRLAIFIAIFASVALAEWARPKRGLSQSWVTRWRINLSIFVIDVLVLRFTLGAAAFAAAVYAQSQGWGLFAWLDWPGWLEGIAAVVLLDFAIYLQHVLSHALPGFWRLHRVHHLDLDVDLTTGLRFHPGEILISMLYKVALVAALGPDPWAVVIYEAILNGASLYTHGNVALPVPVDRALRWVLCTPDMHRVHHSTIPVETNSNYGNFLSVWDRLCGTYRAAPQLGQDGIEIGLRDERAQAKLGLARLLALPFYDRR